MGCPCCHMHVHSMYSFKDGLAPPEQLVRMAAMMGHSHLALTDHGVMYGAVPFFQECAKHDIQGIIGMEAYEAVPHTFDLNDPACVELFKTKWADMKGDRYYHLTLWAMNEEGYKNLCALHTLSFSESKLPTVRTKPMLDRASLAKHSAGVAVGLGCMASRTNVQLMRDSYATDGAYAAAKWMVEVFEGRCFMEIMGNLPEQVQLQRSQRQLAVRLGIPVIATNDVHYVQQSDGVEHGPHHILVQARAFKKAAGEEESNARDDDGFGQWYGSDEFYLKNSAEMLATDGFQQQDLVNAQDLAYRCDFDFNAMMKRNPPQPPEAIIPEPGSDSDFDLWIPDQNLTPAV